MSLDVYLELDEPRPGPRPTGGIFVREGGQTLRISREEWDRRYPGRAPVTFASDEDSREVYTANVTHNLNAMADEAGLYEALWRPDEAGIARAEQLAPVLADGLCLLVKEPERFREFNPANGWGSYDTLVRFVLEYLQACIRWPEAAVRACR